MYTLHGALASPYSMKMRAILRYRRIAHIWSHGESTRHATANVKAPVIPVLEFPDGTFANDSTPLIYLLEDRHSERSIIPDDPAHAFLAHLIEDFADEWLTKAMFGYRWLEEIDQEQMSRWLAFDQFKGGGLDRLEDYASTFKDRQVGRMALVGCTQENFALIGSSTARILKALEAYVVDNHWFFGSRPSLAEFGVFGQLSQLGVDPTAQNMMRTDFPYAYRWLLHVDDASGLVGSWAKSSSELSAVVKVFLSEIGRVYSPFLLANEAAAIAERSTFRFEVDGLPYEQGTFKYQVKCLADLRSRFAALPEPVKAGLGPVLEEAGLLRMLAV